MIITEKFRHAMFNLKKYWAKGEVGLIFRWDNDDSKIETVWSEGYVFSSKLDVGVTPRENIVKLKKTEQSYVAKEHQPRLGGHAEEIMISQWAYFVSRYGDPKVIDIILTHSPCLDKSEIFLDSIGHMWPLGCTHKLYKLINQVASGVDEWNIGYMQYYGGDASRGSAIQALSVLGAHPKVNIYNLEGFWHAGFIAQNVRRN